MRETSDPNELQPLTVLANHTLQEYTQKVKEFATSSRWAASAIAVHMDEGPDGYNVLMGFELRTPLDFPLEDTITSHGVTKEQAALKSVDEWLKLFIRSAMRVHRDEDPHLRFGETPPLPGKQGPTYFWCMVEGPLLVSSENLEDMEQVKKDLAELSIFDRVGMREVLPFHHEVPIVCLKLMVERKSGGGLEYECKINNEDWPAGLARLKRFELPPGSKRLLVKQYVFLRHSAAKMKTAKAAAPAAKGSERTKSISSSRSQRKPWWKFW